MPKLNANWKHWPADKKLAFLERLRAKREGALSWTPSPRQQQVIETEAFETLYGGAAGGAKTNLMVMLAKLGHHRAVIFRRTYPQLEDGVIPECSKWYGDIKFYNGSKHLWHWPDTGQRIRLSHLQHEKSIYDHQGAEYDLIAFDELTQFTLKQYEYLLSRVRTTRKGQRTRVLAASNPGGEGHAWVRERWAAWLDDKHPNPAEPGEVRWYIRTPDGVQTEVPAGTAGAKSRTFIPAFLSDNPHLSEDYRHTLELLPEPWRSQLLNGDWSAGEEDHERQVIPTAWVRAAQSRWSKSGRPTGKDGKPVPMDCVGVDVARGGADETVLCRRYGLWCDVDAYPGKVTPDGQTTVGLMAKALTEGGFSHYDMLNCGTSVEDLARENRLPARGVNFAESSSATDRSGRLKIRNVRAECYWYLRELLDPNLGEPVALPPDPRILADLTAPRWEMTASGLKIESKDEIKSRLGRSPDWGDAVVMAYWPGRTLPKLSDIIG